MHHVSDYSQCTLQARGRSAAASGSSATTPVKASPTPIINSKPAPALLVASEETMTEQTPVKISRGVIKEVGNSIDVRATAGPVRQVCKVEAFGLCVCRSNAKKVHVMWAVSYKAPNPHLCVLRACWHTYTADYNDSL